jgi:hypothetical protein
MGAGALGICAFGGAGIVDPRLPIVLLLFAMIPVTWCVAGRIAKGMVEKWPRRARTFAVVGDFLLLIGVLGLCAPASRLVSFLIITIGLRLTMSRLQKLTLKKS